ncbi:Asp23/Gls24 family envelope stress response protein [Candidatus Enterococcus ikei]|uniref:Stress response regulator gls24 homolog n=1 Tax=Candidatus Enterococcus ikei TaxID=2815326 RepID=A0ABS3GXX6_9ENTE|nr:Asp23/Gls24 family envelope stress response protein [Enterococcus sp. DIV0869a]MBO0440112.1 Asp23/Gls24 family envelope stress response protein [Enterococcus sp. DIV0869a]
MVEEVQNNNGGMKAKLTFDDVVIKKIVGIVISDIDGILGLSGNLFTDFADRFRDNEDITKGIDVEVGTKQVAVDVSVICKYDVAIASVFDQAVEKVKEAVHYMTGLDLVEFNMNVDDVMTNEQYLEKYRGKDSEDNKGSN